MGGGGVVRSKVYSRVQGWGDGRKSDEFERTFWMLPLIISLRRKKKCESLSKYCYLDGPLSILLKSN